MEKVYYERRVYESVDGRASLKTISKIDGETIEAVEGWLITNPYSTHSEDRKYYCIS